MMNCKEKIKSIFTASRFIAMIVILTMLFSCEKTIHMDIKDERRRIVVNGFLSSQLSVQVNVSRSQHILDNAPINFIDDAKVYLFKNGIIADTLIYSQNGDYFSHNYMPEIGINYTIKVSADGLQDVEASDYIPDMVPIISIDTATVMYSGNGGDLGGVGESREMLRCKIKFQDPTGQQNYYQLQLLSSYNNGYSGYNMYFETDDSSVEDLIMDYGAFFNDELFDGKTHEINIYTDKMYQGGILYFNLFSVSKNYSLYFRTLGSFQQNSGGPFSEPVMVYNNITNGLGIFAGYSLSVSSLAISKK